MKSGFVRVFCLLFFAGMVVPIVPAQKTSSPSKSSPPPHLTRETRENLIRTFTAELVFIRTQFPMGRKGLTLKDGTLSPQGQDLQQLIAMWGPSVKPGDEARLTSVVVKSDRIRFEINGGPVKRQKWYQHIEIGVGGPSTAPIAPSDANANPRGSYLELVFDHYVPDLNPRQLKDLLWPAFDFDSKSPLEAYLETVPPKVKEAIKDHRVLVGMDREMVIYAKGRPPKKVREKDGEVEHEDWIYGEPPQDVDFVRFVGDEVVRVETMKVDGEKIVRTEKEVDLAPKPTVAKASEEQRPANAPTLRRPGEEAPPSNAPAKVPVVVPPVGGDPNATQPNYADSFIGR